MIATYSTDFLASLDLDLDWSEHERTALRAAELRAENRWDELAELDGALAAIGWDSLLHDHAQRARALWRIESGDVERAREAIALMDQALTRHRSREHYYHRIRAAVAAGEQEIAWAGLDHFVGPQTVKNRALSRALLSLVRKLGEPEDDPSRVINLLRQGVRQSARQ